MNQSDNEASNEAKSQAINTATNQIKLCNARKTELKKKKKQSLNK